MGKNKGKGKIVDGLKPSEMARPQLLGYIVRLQAEMEKEREERNYFMLEREKIFQLWNLIMEKIQLEKEKAALFDSHMQETEKMKDGEDELYNQKLRFLKQEHTRKLGEVRLQHLSMMKHIQDDNWAIYMIMKESLMGKKKEIRQAQLAFYQIIRGLYWKHSKDISDLRNEFAHQIREHETSFDRRLFENEEKKDDVFSKDISLLASTKESQINTLVESHRYQTKELTKFFRDMIRHNLGLIYGMKDAAKKEKTLELRAKTDYEKFKGKYEKYVSTAVQWKKDMESWSIQHIDDNPEEYIEELKIKTEESSRLKKISRIVECSNETLLQRMEIAKEETESLKSEFTRSIVEAQKKMSMNRFVNEMKVKGAKREGECYEALADNIEKEEDDTMNYFTALLSARESEMNNLRADITDFATEHKNVEENYKQVFIQNEIHLADIGFPIKKTGAKSRGNDLLANVADAGDRTSRVSSNRMSNRHRSLKESNRSKSKTNISSPSSKQSMGTPSPSHSKSKM